MLCPVTRVSGNFFISMAGIYVHIPFCKRKCIYCDFYSISARTGVVHDYAEALCREAGLRREELQGDAVKTVYIGGGTPSLLPVEELLKIEGNLRDNFDLLQVEEFTIEVNPDDVTSALVEKYRQAGINRVSMGVQSFVDDELKFINRRHDSARAVAAYEAILDGGIGNISIDLIYGIPGQTMQSWRHSLDVAVNLKPKHISCYNLSYEEGTRLHRMLCSGAIDEVDDDTCVKMYELMADVLRLNGYEHYEISNFALPGYHSRHNSNYWNKTAYLGLGASAHSYTRGVRSYNPADIKTYMSAIGSGNVAAVADAESVGERYDEEVMLRLRTSRGLDAAQLRIEYGEPYYSHFLRTARQFVDAGLVENDGSIYRLSRSGVMLSDMIIRELMYVEA